MKEMVLRGGEEYLYTASQKRPIVSLQISKEICKRVANPKRDL